jgi:hypothetical protein
LAAERSPVEGPLEPLLGQPEFSVRPLFTGQRFPNVVVALDGTVLATWGGRPANHRYLVRRSEDGGKTWPIKRLVEAGPFAYSSLAAGRPATPSEGWIYLLYEAGGHPDSNGHLARFNLAWLLEGTPIGDGHVPLPTGPAPMGAGMRWRGPAR